MVSYEAKRKLLFVVPALLVLALGSTFIALPSVHRSRMPVHNLPSLEGTVVVRIGYGSDLCAELCGRLAELSATVISYDEIPSLVTLNECTFLEIDDVYVELNSGLTILFDGVWLENHYNDTKTLEFIREVGLKGCKLVAVGGATSKLYPHAVILAGLEQVPPDMTAEEWATLNEEPDFPLIGFRLKVEETPEGPHTYPSILRSNTTDIDELIEALINW